jgi:hypothetical protein
MDSAIDYLKIPNHKIVPQISFGAKKLSQD